MDLVKEILFWFGASCAVLYVLIILYCLAKWIIDKFTARVIKGVCDNLQMTDVRGSKRDKWESEFPDVDEYCNHYIMMVVNGTWQLVDLEKFVKSYIDIAKEEDQNANKPE